jgi:hypothetical protein
MDPKDHEPTDAEVARNNRETAALEERNRIASMLKVMDTEDTEFHDTVTNAFSYGHLGNRFEVTVKCTTGMQGS